MVVADFNLEAQSVTENPCIREAGFKPFPNWLSKDEAPETLEGLNLETLLSHVGILNEESSELDFRPLPMLVKAVPIPGTCEAAFVAVETAWSTGLCAIPAKQMQQVKRTEVKFFFMLHNFLDKKVGVNRPKD